MPDILILPTAHRLQTYPIFTLLQQQVLQSTVDHTDAILWDFLIEDLCEVFLLVLNIKEDYAYQIHCLGEYMEVQYDLYLPTRCTREDLVTSTENLLHQWHHLLIQHDAYNSDGMLHYNQLWLDRPNKGIFIRRDAWFPGNSHFDYESYRNPIPRIHRR